MVTREGEGATGGDCDGGRLPPADSAAPALPPSPPPPLQADSNNHLLRRVNLTSGLVTTLAGNATRGRADGVGTAATFYSPGGVAVDAAGSTAIVVRGGRGGGGCCSAAHGAGLEEEGRRLPL